MSTKYPFPSHVSVQSFVTVKLSDKGTYGLWKTQMLCLLESHDMLDFIKTSGSMLDADWKRSDALVNGWILGSLSEQAAVQVLSRLGSKQTDFNAKETWDQVQIMYGQQAAEREEARSTGGERVKDLAKRMEEVKNRSKNKQQLYLAAESGRLEDFRSILRNSKIEITEGISINGNTALHVATAKREDDFLESVLSDDSYCIPLMEVRNSDGSTLLHVAASAGNKKAAKILVARCPDLLSAKDNHGCTPLDISTLCTRWNGETFRFLLESSMTAADIEQLLDPTLFELPLVIAISYGYFDLAQSFIQRYKYSLKSGALLMALAQHCPSDFKPYAIIIDEWCNNRFINRGTLDIVKDHGYLKSANMLLIAVSVYPFRMLIWICMKLSVFKDFKEKMERRRVAREVLDTVCGLIKFSNDASSYPDFYTEPILEAIRRDASDVVERIVYWFPRAAMVVDEDGNNITQVAFKNRSTKVIAVIVNQFLAKYTSLSQKIKDEHCGNNFLHFAARLAPSKKLDSLSSPPFRMQRELKWFKVAQVMVPQGHMEEKNCFGETPEMVFTREHKELVTESGNWMKSTANSFALTATLIITVVFAAAITVPGGDHGKPAFILFEASVAISMVTSFLSLVLLLSILTSRLTEQDFLVRLPLTLVMGLVSLFVSATFTMLAFGAALFLIFGSKYPPWTTLGLIAPLIGLPVCFSFVYVLNSHLLSDCIVSAGQLFIIPFSRRLKLLGRIFI